VARPDKEAPFLRRPQVVPRKGRRPAALRLALFGALGLAAAFGLLRFAASSRFALSRYEVSDNTRARTEEILVALAPWKGRNLISLDLQPLASRLGAHPWIERVTLAKRFPDGLAVRAELFEKTTHGARPRYENLFDPLVLLPELRPGRVRIAPERGEARGLEVLLSATHPFSWWLGYSFAHADDVIDGQNVPRSWDQRDALNAGITHDVGPWTLSAVLNAHTGWPATTLSLVPSNAPNAVDGVVAVPGSRNAERLGATGRVDFRAGRAYAVGAGSVRVFAEVTNLTGRENVCCLRYEQADTPIGAPPELAVEARNGLPFTVNLGALWQF